MPSASCLLHNVFVLLCEEEIVELKHKADMKVNWFVQTGGWDEAGAGGGWHCELGRGRTYMGRHGWLQINMGWMAHLLQTV